MRGRRGRGSSALRPTRRSARPRERERERRKGGTAPTRRSDRFPGWGRSRPRRYGGGSHGSGVRRGCSTRSGSTRPWGKPVNASTSARAASRYSATSGSFSAVWSSRRSNCAWTEVASGWSVDRVQHRFDRRVAHALRDHGHQVRGVVVRGEGGEEGFGSAARPRPGSTPSSEGPRSPPRRRRPRRSVPSGAPRSTCRRPASLALRGCAPRAGSI